MLKRQLRTCYFIPHLRPNSSNKIRICIRRMSEISVIYEYAVIRLFMFRQNTYMLDVNKLHRETIIFIRTIKIGAYELA